jgi:phenylalanyl-tRNA synthetase alpha chain
MADLSEIKRSFLAEIEKAKNAEELEKIRVKYLGRSGEATAVLRSLKNLPIEKRRKIGPEAQALKRELEKLFDKKVSNFKFQVSGPRVDLTAPGKKIERGHLHPLTLVDREIRRIFTAMNFSVVEGPEVETEYYNFDALNIPANHPARDMWDTFWLKTRTNAERTRTYAEKDLRKSASSQRESAMLLRTHTSPVQVRYMEEHRPPFQIVVPGRAFRYEATDASHEINFYQLEGLMVGKDVSLANFKFVVEEFFKKFFKNQKIEFRYRPSYFPFVEPGLEVEVKIGNKWLEMMGAGMVHPRVFEYAHYNPRDWRGFAFGMGIDRLAMIKYKIPDIRMFYSGDLRFVKQF